MTASETLHDLLDRTAETRPDAPAVSCGAGRMTYAEVAEASRRIAAELMRRGVSRGDRVIVVTPPDVMLPALLYACSRVGAPFAVIAERPPEPLLVHILADAEPALIVTDDPRASDLAAEAGVATMSLPDVRDAVRTGHDRPPAVHGPIPVDPVCLIYTSGSTGMPKAVVSTHAQLTFAATAIQSQLGYRDDDVVFSALPLSFDYGLYQLFLCTLGGAMVRLALAADAGPMLLAELHRTGATVLAAVPHMAQGLARLLSRKTSADLRLRLLTNTGAAMPAEVLASLRERIPGLRIQLMFGLTECKRATIMPVDEDLRRPGSCGRALPGTEVFATDSDGSRLPSGEIGELVVRGPNVMAGYWRRPDLTARWFPKVDGLFPQLRTGDYGWLDEDGFLYFVGRRDDLYKQRGFRVSAIEVAAAANRLPGVEAAVVVPPGEANRDATLVAVTALAPHEVLDRLGGELEVYKIPARCHVVPAIPYNRNGKPDLSELRRMVTDDSRS